MKKPSVFDVYSQLTFYGAYHSNPINVLIHMICVPCILWSSQVILAGVPLPEFIPKFHYVINDYLTFDVNFSFLFSTCFLVYYYILESVAAFIYTPQMILSLLTATAFSHTPNALYLSSMLHGFCWICQFLGHGVAERRAPALFDNLLGALVLAPLFVHFHVLFLLGYRPDIQRRLQNDIGKAIADFRKREK